MADLRTHRDLTERGETAIVGALLSLGPAFCVLPHLVVPGKAWPEAPDDLDVIVFGPGGVAILAYHHWQGTVEAARSGAWRIRFPGGGAEERENPLGVLEDKAQTLVDYLAERGVPPPNVTLGLVFPERTRLEGDPGVAVTDTSRVADWVSAHVGSGSDPTWPRRAADQVRPPNPARLVNQYQITSVLRRHPDRATYLAYDTLGAKPVILRELLYDPYLQADQLDKLRQELLREAKLTMELEHPNVVRVERVIPKDDRYYIASEWIDSCQNLRERLDAAAPLPPDEALGVAAQVAAALAHAHGKGIIHRDVRPENVLVAPGVVKITNFGMAKKADMGTRPTFDLRKMATESPYAAPEFKIGQDGHHHVDARADIFALGVMLYEMITGQLPGHLDEKYWEPPSQFARDLPPGLDEVVAKALKFDPAQRCSTMNAFRERLLHVRDRLPDHPDSPRVRYGDRKLIRRTRNSLIYQATDRKMGRPVALKRMLVEAPAAVGTSAESAAIVRARPTHFEAPAAVGTSAESAAIMRARRTHLDPGVGVDARKQQLDAILREASIAARLIHPGVVHVLDHFVEDDDGYIVMEWLAGTSLREMLDKGGGQLDTELALDIVSQVGEALHYAHGEGVVHRDIKPENIMVGGGRATILDFGIAQAVEFSDANQGKTAGTARYIAPEVLKGGPADDRADVFSLGVMAYEMLTGRYPYQAQTIIGHYDTGLLAEGVPAPSALNLEVSSRLSSVVVRAIAADPDERFGNIGEFLEALAAARGRRTGGVGRDWKRVAAWSAGIATAVLAVGGTYLVLTSPHFSRSPKQPSALLASPEATDSVGFFAGEATETASAVAEVVASAFMPVEPAPVTAPTPELQTARSTPAPPRPTRAPRVTWMSSPQHVGGVTVEVVSVEPSAGQTLVTLRVHNETADDVRLLADEGAIQIADSKGADYSASMDFASVTPNLRSIGGGAQVEGTFTFRHGVDADADSLSVVLKEDGGLGRIWNIKAHRMVD